MNTPVLPSPIAPVAAAVALPPRIGSDQNGERERERWDGAGGAGEGWGIGSTSIFRHVKPLAMAAAAATLRTHKAKERHLHYFRPEKARRPPSHA